MVLISYPDSIKKMKDSFGFHRVKVYNDTRILRDMIQLRLKARAKRQDSIYLVCGIEGSGKSKLTLTAGDIYEQETGTQLPAENICRKIDELLDRLRDLERDAFLTLDEGSELDSGRWNEKKTKDIKEKFTAIRERAFIIFICYTNPLKIVTYLREDRIRGVFFIKSHGCVYYYANSPENSHFSEILDVWTKDNRTKSLKRITKYAPDFIMYYPVYDGHLIEVYNQRKDSHITDVLGKPKTEAEIIAQTAVKEKYYTRIETCRLLNMSVDKFDKLERNGLIFREYVGIKRMIPQRCIDDVLKTLVTLSKSRNDANIIKDIEKDP